MSDTQVAVVKPVVAGNPVQVLAVAELVATMFTVRNLKVTIEQIPAESITFGNPNPRLAIASPSWAIPKGSIAFLTKGENGEYLPDFPALTVSTRGKFSIPSVRSYKEGNVPNTLLAYPLGATTFDAALFADSHTRKQGGAWLRRSPQAATAVIVGEQNTAKVIPPDPFKDVPAPALSAETGQDTAKLTQEIQGKKDEKPADNKTGFETGKRK